MQKSLVYTFLFALPLASALPWEGPEPTAAPVNDLRDLGFFSPMPSAPAALFAAYELKKRQTTTAATTSSTFIHATCGFLTGDPGNPLTCVNSGYKCAVDTARTVFGCCSDLAACTVRTSCIPQSALSSCGTDCQSDPFLAKCNPTYPFCNQNLLVATGSPTLTNWYCDDSPTIVTQFAIPTTGTLSGSYAYITLAITSHTTSSSSVSIISSSSTSVSQSIVTITPTPSPTPSPTPTPTPKKTPIGAIVGGVVGGIALIIAAIIGFICFKRKKSNNPPAPVEVPVGNPGPGYGPVPGNTAEPGVGGFYQPAIAEKEAPLPTGQHQQGRAEMYSPPQSPAPQYTPTYPAGHQPSHQVPHQPSPNVYPNVAEMGSGEISAHAAPGSY